MNQSSQTNHANPGASSGFDFWSLIVGILYIIVGIMAYNDPINGVGLVAYLLAFSAIYRGISYLASYFMNKRRTGYGDSTLIILGVIDLIAGIILLVNMRGSIIAIPTVFAIWFIVSSIMSLFSAGRLRARSHGKYMIVIILSILGIITGLMLLSNPLAAILTISMFVSFYFIISGISNIVQAY